MAHGDKDMMKRGISVEVDATAYKFLLKAGDSIPKAVVTVKMINKAGHRIPDGRPSPQRLVLDVTAKTKDGKEIFKDSKIYMTQATNSRGDAMVYGAHFKMGYTRYKPAAFKEED